MRGNFDVRIVFVALVRRRRCRSVEYAGQAHKELLDKVELSPAKEGETRIIVPNSPIHHTLGRSNNIPYRLYYLVLSFSSSTFARSFSAEAAAAAAIAAVRACCCACAMAAEVDMGASGGG